MNTGQENFTEILLKGETEKGGMPKTVGQFGKSINDLLFINQLKHMWTTTMATSNWPRRMRAYGYS